MLDFIVFFIIFYSAPLFSLRLRAWTKQASVHEHLDGDDIVVLPQKGIGASCKAHFKTLFVMYFFRKKQPL